MFYRNYPTRARARAHASLLKPSRFSLSQYTHVLHLLYITSKTSNNPSDVRKCVYSRFRPSLNASLARVPCPPLQSECLIYSFRRVIPLYAERFARSRRYWRLILAISREDEVSNAITYGGIAVAETQVEKYKVTFRAQGKFNPDVSSNRAFGKFEERWQLVFYLIILSAIRFYSLRVDEERLSSLNLLIFLLQERSFYDVTHECA